MTQTSGTPAPTSAFQIARDAYVDTDLLINLRLDNDQETAILTYGDQFFAISEEYSDGAFDGYSWAWGVNLDGETDYFGEDGGTTEAEARAAVAEWIAQASA